MMKPFLAMIAAVLLTACAGPTYYPVQPSGEGGYYVARSPAARTVASYEVAYAYSALPTYGIYPWWGYSYYSPYFYPHHFSIWQPGWPYYAGGYWAWHGGYPYGFPHWDRHTHAGPQRHPPVPGAPGNGLPNPPNPAPAVRPGPGHAVTLSELYREQSRRRGSRLQLDSVSGARRLQPATAPSMRASTARRFEPPAAAASAPSFIGSSAPPVPAVGGRALHSRETSGRIPSQRDR
jgi:hypothetical protein